MRSRLKLDTGGDVVELGFADPAGRDFRVPADSPLLSKGCYPQGEVPGVRLECAGDPQERPRRLTGDETTKASDQLVDLAPSLLGQVDRPRIR